MARFTLALALLCATSSLQAARPNIVFLMTDDQSTYSMGCYGNPDVQTPNLDRLAHDGIVFDRHYATTAICMASRATVMTGKYEYKTGCNFMHGNMLAKTWSESYPVLLRNSGYMTAFAGKFGFELKATPDSARLPLPESDFDKWGGSPGQSSYETVKNKSMAAYAAEFPHSTLSYGAFGRDFIQEAASANRPFCLSISFKAPHKPATPDSRFDKVYRDKSFVKPANFGRAAGRHFAAQSKVDRQYERFYSWNYADNYDAVMGTYHQQVHGVDAAVGMIRDALKKHGVANNTVIIYTSDNGFFCGSHGYGSKVLPYEESSRIPMIVFDPRRPKAGNQKSIRCGSLTGLIDIAPTILGLAGLPIPSDVDGASLMALVADPDKQIHESIALINVWGHPATHALAAVTRDRKYIYWSYADDEMTPAEELYLLDEDPLEMHNQAASKEHRKTLEQMRDAYDKHLGQWKTGTVAFNDYHQYASIIDRSLDWSAKKRLIAPQFIKAAKRKKPKPRSRSNSAVAN